MSRSKGVGGGGGLHLLALAVSGHEALDLCAVAARVVQEKMNGKHAQVTEVRLRAESVLETYVAPVHGGGAGGRSRGGGWRRVWRQCWRRVVHHKQRP